MGEVVSLREYIDARLDAEQRATAIALTAAKEAVAAALAASKEAVTKAEAATEKRFENSNEWRATVESLQRNFAPKDQIESLTRLVYIGLGIVLALQFVSMYLKK